jgi:hypothetical protein
MVRCIRPGSQVYQFESVNSKALTYGHRRESKAGPTTYRITTFPLSVFTGQKYTTDNTSNNSVHTFLEYDVEGRVAGLNFFFL